MVQHQVMAGAEDAGQVVAAGRVDRDAERVHALVHGFLDRDAGVFVQITDVPTVVVVLRAPVGEDT